MHRSKLIDARAFLRWLHADTENIEEANIRCAAEDLLAWSIALLDEKTIEGSSPIRSNMVH